VSFEEAEEAAAQSRWKKSEYGWSQLNEESGRTLTSRESNAYWAPVTHSSLPAKVP